MSLSDFSSWPREQEQTFVVYEQRTNESQRSAYIVGAIAGLVLLVATVGIYAGVAPNIKDVSKDFNMSNLTKKSKDKAPAEAPEKQTAPTPAPAQAPAPEAAAPTPEAPAAAPASE